MKQFIKNFLNKRLNNEKGLTLIELLAVIVILGIIAAIAVPAIGNIINESRDKAIVSEALNVISAAKLADVNGACETANKSGEAKDVCNEDELADYVEGQTLTGITVTKGTGGVWTIAGVGAGNLGTIKNTTDYNANGTEESLAAQID